MDDCTIRSAVWEVLNGLPRDRNFNGYDFIDLTRTNLKRKGYEGRPYDATILRELRRQKASHNIQCVDVTKSIYHKGL